MFRRMEAKERQEEDACACIKSLSGYMRKDSRMRQRHETMQGTVERVDISEDYTARLFRWN